MQDLLFIISFSPFMTVTLLRGLLVSEENNERKDVTHESHIKS